MDPLKSEAVYMSYASRMHGQWIVDFEARVNPERLRKERQQKLREQIRKHKLGALLLYGPTSIRYATSTRFLSLFTAQRFYRYVLVPKQSDPILFEMVGVEYENRLAFAPWLKNGNTLRPAIVWQYSGPATEYQAQKWAESLREAMRDCGVTDEQLGIDRFDIHMLRAMQKEKINFVDGWPAVWDATNVKTKDELELLKESNAIVDASLEVAKSMIKPGVRECDIAGNLTKTLFSLGCEGLEALVVASGGHTNPYLREFTDRIVRCGDLVILDIDPAGPGGYYSDFVRTFLCGDKATEEQKKLYNEAYGNLQEMMRPIRAGASTTEICETFPTEQEEAEKLETTGLLHFAHGVGINLYEPPVITRAFSLKYPMKLKENMFLAVETYAGKRGGRQGVRVEENIIVTDTGFEVTSLYPHDERLLN